VHTLHIIYTLNKEACYAYLVSNKSPWSCKWRMLSYLKQTAKLWRPCFDKLQRITLLCRLHRVGINTKHIGCCDGTRSENCHHFGPRLVRESHQNPVYPSNYKLGVACWWAPHMLCSAACPWKVRLRKWSRQHRCRKGYLFAHNTAPDIWGWRLSSVAWSITRWMH